jgi:hypothetical protein
MANAVEQGGRGQRSVLLGLLAPQLVHHGTTNAFDLDTRLCEDLTRAGSEDIHVYIAGR